MSEEKKTMNKKPFKRKHGFKCPFHVFQVLSWIFFGLKTSSFYILLAPAIFTTNLIFYVVVQSVYAILNILVVSFTIKVTISDTEDHMIKHPELYDFEDEEFLFRCSVCESYVNYGTKHCG